MARNAEITATGRVSPVMTVERHELRKVNTTITVRSAPSRIVIFTSSTESLIHTESSRTIESSIPGGSSRRNSSTVAFRFSAIWTVFPPRTLRMSMPMAGTPSTIAAERGSSASSRVTATSPSRMGTPPRMSTTRRSNSAGSCNRPATRTSRSPGPNSSRPAGTSRFSEASVAMICATVTDRAAMRSGSISTAITRFSAPMTVIWPTPSTPSIRFFRVSSARLVSSRKLRVSERRAREMIGRSARLNLRTFGSSACSGRSSRISSILDRTSCCASRSFTLSSNSMKIEERPSCDVEVSCRTPAIGFTASSMGRVSSRSTASGEAPG